MTCIYPGCERPAIPPHPLGGPQPSFCDLEEHNAPDRPPGAAAARTRDRFIDRRTRLRRLIRGRRGIPSGVLRCAPHREDGAQPDHRADGNEGRYAQLVARSSGCRARREGRAGRHRPLRRGPRLQHEPVAGTSAAVASASAKIREKAQLLAARRSGLSPRAQVGGGRVHDGRGPAGVPDDRRPRPVRARHGRPPGVEGGLDAQTVYRD